MGISRLTTTGGALGAVLLAAVVGIAPTAGVEQDAAEVQIDQIETGNLFVDDRSASFSLGDGAPAGSYRVLDERGAHVLVGEVDDGQQQLELPDLEPGQYVLDIVPEQGEPARTTFVIVDGWSGERDDRFGMNTKFGIPEDGQAPVWDPEQQAYDPVGTPSYQQDIVPALAQTGTSQIRDTIAWNQFEPEEALYTGGPPWYEEYLDGAAEEGITPLVILSYGNKLYDVDEEGIGAAPYTEEGIQAYADYASAVLSSYGGVVQEVEVWNEYNGAGAPWNRGPCKADARCYYEMLKVTHEVVQETHPEATVVGPAGVTIPYGWLEELFSYGALDYLDAVTVHPYGFPASPEMGYPRRGFGNGLERRIEDLDALVREYNDGESKPIWFTEIGWGSYAPAPRGVTESTQADYLVRSHVIALASGVDRIHWYSLRNSLTLPRGPGANWGLLRAPDDPLGYYAPKESYGAYAELTRQVSGAEFTARDAAPVGVHSYAFAGADGVDLRVLWGIGARQHVTLRADEPLVVTSIDGEERTLHPYQGFVHLTAGSDPVYVAGDVQAVQGPGMFALSTPGSVTEGEPLTATFTVDGTEEPRATPAQVTVEGQREMVVARPGSTATRDFTVTTDGAAERRTVTAEVKVRGKLVGWLAADTPVN